MRYDICEIRPYVPCNVRYEDTNTFIDIDQSYKKKHTYIHTYIHSHSVLTSATQHVVAIRAGYPPLFVLAAPRHGVASVDDVLLLLFCWWC